MELCPLWKISAPREGHLFHRVALPNPPCGHRLSDMLSSEPNNYGLLYHTISCNSGMPWLCASLSFQAVRRWRWVWGRPQQQAEQAQESEGPPAEDASGDGGAAGGRALGGPQGGRQEAPVAMERASSSSGGPLLATTPVNFPGMHAVRRSHDGTLVGTLNEGPPALEE